jgi:hypothetical protein
MRRLKVITPAFVLIAACGSGPTPQEQNLSEREQGPEQAVNTAVANIAGGTAPAAEQNQLGDTMPKHPGGPGGDTASGTGGDTVPSH